MYGLQNLINIWFNFAEPCVQKEHVKNIRASRKKELHVWNATEALDR